jgi:hypothetical protein
MGLRMVERGFERHRGGKGVRMWLGLGLRSSGEEQPELALVGEPPGG